MNEEEALRRRGVQKHPRNDWRVCRDYRKKQQNPGETYKLCIQHLLLSRKKKYFPCRSPRESERKGALISTKTLNRKKRRSQEIYLIQAASSTQDIKTGPQQEKTIRIKRNASALLILLGPQERSRQKPQKLTRFGGCGGVFFWGGGGGKF